MRILGFLPLLFCVPALADSEVEIMRAEPERGWKGNETGEGFLRGTRMGEIKISRAFGTTEMGSTVSHDLWLTHLQGGLILSDVLGAGRWYSGNLEGTGHLLWASQDNPEAGYLAAMNVGFRYHIVTHTRIVPFISGSIGVGLTDIGSPDLSGKFQFNEQVGAGARYFLSKDYAVGLEYSLMHVSNGGIRRPNGGITAHVISIGLSCLF